MSKNVVELSGVQGSNDQGDQSAYKKYMNIWDQPNALDVLLDVVGSEEYIGKLTSTSYKKKSVWEEIASKIEARGILLGENPCKVAYQKWLNLKKTFISILNKKGSKPPLWFGKLNEIFEKSEGKLLGNAGVQGEEERGEDKEPALKKMKQEFLPVGEDGEVQIQLEPGQFVIEEVSQVTYGDVIAIMQQLETERREREEARERREKERFDKLADLLKQQNALTEKLITILSKQSTKIEPVENSSVLKHVDSAVRIITTDEIRH